VKAIVRRDDKMKMREAKPSDEGVLQGLWQRFMTELHRGESPTREESESWGNRLRSQIDRRQVIVAEDSQGMQGFAGFIDHADRAFVPPMVALLVDLYVTPELRRTGIAQALLRAIMKRAAADGCKRMWTNTDEENQTAQRCIERTGFQGLEGFALPGLKSQKHYQMEITRHGAEPGG
jgi:GNAT superfamily N-acetyltransferase